MFDKYPSYGDTTNKETSNGHASLDATIVDTDGEWPQHTMYTSTIYLLLNSKVGFVCGNANLLGQNILGLQDQ